MRPTVFPVCSVRAWRWNHEDSDGSVPDRKFRLEGAKAIYTRVKVDGTVTMYWSKKALYQPTFWGLCHVLWPWCSRWTFDGCSWSSFFLWRFQKVYVSWLQTTNVNPPSMPCSDTCPGLIELEVRTLGSTRSYTFGRKRLETGRCSRPFAAAIISLTLNLADLCCRDWQYLHDNLFKRYNRALNPYLYWYLRS